jgi:epsilon-lactone hydrolase
MMTALPSPPLRKRTSWSALAVRLLLLLMRRRRAFASIDGLMSGIAASRRKGSARPTPRMNADLDIQQETLAGCEVYTLRPRETPSAQRVALYLHGGAYCRPITVQHWSFVQWLSLELGLTVVVPLYPLAPESTCAATVQAVRNVHAAIVERHGPIDALLGDSAGGGLCLALCQSLRAENEALPDRMVLITPWVDVSLANPDIPATEARDPFLAAIGLREAGRLYAGDLGVEHPLVSPLHADLAGLPPMLILVGTDDILGHDALLFAASAARGGCSVQTEVGQGMVHVWPLLPIAEARACRSTIRKFLDRRNAR